MCNGTLRVQTYAARESAPVGNVRIRLRSADDQLAQEMVFYTDDGGVAPDLELPAPPASLSLDENATQRPYSVWDLTADKEGYQTLTLEGLQVFAGQVALAELELRPMQRLGAPAPLPDSFDVPPHQLYSPGSGAPSSAPVQLCEPRVLTVPIIPETITVHLGKPAASAQNVTVSFRKYIANVASSEVYPTWPEQALRANIHAQISLALNRIFTEWYPSKGYNFNITNSTSYDQYYVHGREIFEPMERITDDIFNTYVRREGTIEPYYTEYCDGKTVSCPGMKQWGTVDRANEGKKALEILRYYYGSNIEVVETNNIQSIPASYPGSPLRRGSSGENVKIIQRQLNRIAKDYPAFGTLTVDGKFGKATEDTVKKFQKQFGLTQDGVVGKSTWYKISYIYVSVTDLAQLTSEGIPQTGTVPYPGTALRQGSTGSDVRQIQTWLNGVSDTTAGVTPLTVDGKFGPATQTAVRAFQKAYGLRVDGIVGRSTWTALNQAYLSDTQGIARALDQTPRLPAALGDRGDTVGAIAQRLELVAYYLPDVTSYGYTTQYDELLEASVKTFQAREGLPQTGITDQATWDRLETVYFALLEDAVEIQEG